MYRPAPATRVALLPKGMNRHKRLLQRRVRKGGRRKALVSLAAEKIHRAAAEHDERPEYRLGREGRALLQRFAEHGNALHDALGRTAQQHELGADRHRGEHGEAPIGMDEGGVDGDDRRARKLVALALVGP